MRLSDSSRGINSYTIHASELYNMNIKQNCYTVFQQLQMDRAVLNMKTNEMGKERGC